MCYLCSLYPVRWRDFASPNIFAAFGMFISVSGQRSYLEDDESARTLNVVVDVDG